jgi:hypothetical protein
MPKSGRRKPKATMSSYGRKAPTSKRKSGRRK